MKRAIVILLLAAAATARAGTSVHGDMYMLSFSRADLASEHLGVDHVETFGLTPYVAPHFGVGVETWRWLLYAHGGYEFWGVDDAGNHATQLFLELESAPRWDLGPVIASLGPSAGVRWIAGDTWHTGARAMVGAEGELRLHVGGGGSKHQQTTMSLDFFLRLSCTFSDGNAWMLSFGEGWGSLRDEDR